MTGASVGENTDAQVAIEVGNRQSIWTPRSHILLGRLETAIAIPEHDHDRICESVVAVRDRCRQVEIAVAIKVARARSAPSLFSDWFSLRLGKCRNISE